MAKILPIFFLWLSGHPKNPIEISEWIDEAYGLLEEALLNEDESSGIDTTPIVPFELNYKYLIKRVPQILLPSLRKIQGDIIPRVRTQKYGTEIVCDLVLYKKQHGQYPDTLEELWQSDEDRQIATELYDGFVYEKTDDSFKLYHVGQNGVDEKGRYKIPKYDPNDADLEGLLNRKPEQDDILIWPVELEGNH